MSLLGEFDENARRHMRERRDRQQRGAMPLFAEVNLVPYSVKFRVPEDVLIETEIRSWLDNELAQRAFELKAMVVALHDRPVESRSEAVTVRVSATAHACLKVPRTWWDAFKHDAVFVAGNPFFNPRKIRYRIAQAVKIEEKAETVQLVTNAISADLHPDRTVVLPPSYGKPIRVFLDPHTYVERKVL